MLSGWISSHYHPYPWLSTMCRNFIVKSLLTIIVLSCHDIHIFWSLFPLIAGYSVIYNIILLYYFILYIYIIIIILLYYIYTIYISLFRIILMVTLCDIPIFSNGFSYEMIINRVVSGPGRLLCQLEKRPAPWVLSCGRGAEGSVGAEDRQRGPGWSSKHIQIIPTICVLFITFITFITKTYKNIQKHHWLSRSIKMYQRYHYHSSPWFVFNDFHHKSRISPNQLCTVSPCKYLHYIYIYIHSI